MKLTNILIEQQLKVMGPGIANNILKSFETLIDETSQKEDLPPFELCITIQRKEQEVIAIVYWEDISLREIDIMGSILEIFEQSMANVPAIARPWIDKMMKGQTVEDIILDLLNDCSLLLKFDDDDELITYKVQDNQHTLIDWAEFIANIKF